VTRTRQVESLRVREISSAVAVSDIRLAGDGERKIGESEQRATLQNPDAIEMARLDGHLGAGESGADFDHPDSVLPREMISFKERRDTLTFRAVST